MNNATARFQRHQRGFTPYNWSMKPGGGWRIGYGPSSFLIAEGSAWSIRHGREMLQRLEQEYRGVRVNRRPSDRS